MALNSDDEIPVKIYDQDGRVSSLIGATDVLLRIDGQEYTILADSIASFLTGDDGKEYLVLRPGYADVRPGIRGVDVVVTKGGEQIVIVNDLPVRFVDLGLPTPTPITPQLPPVFWDLFTDTNGTLLTNHTSDSGHNWADGDAIFGTDRCKIESNSCVSSATNGGGANYIVGLNVRTSTVAQANVTHTGGAESIHLSFYMRIKVGASSEFVRAWIRELAGDIGLHVVVDGVIIGFIEWDFSAGGTWDIMIKVQGETLSFRVDNELKGIVENPLIDQHTNESFMIQKQALAGDDPWLLNSLSISAG